jgi:hypothetical protein
MVTPAAAAQARLTELMSLERMADARGGAGQRAPPSDLGVTPDGVLQLYRALEVRCSDAWPSRLRVC